MLSFARMHLLKRLITINRQLIKIIASPFQLLEMAVMITRMMEIGMLKDRDVKRVNNMKEMFYIGLVQGNT